MYRHIQHQSLLLGLLAGGLITGILSLRGTEAYHRKGPMNPGHEAMACTDCHQPAPGTLRQQIQANLRHQLGQRDSGSFLGRLPVGNSDCLACHQRADDRHPVFRFMELRFKEVRTAIAPHHCTSCHREHQGKRVTIAMDFCSHCHQNLKLAKDPLQLSHETLVAQKEWQSCLRCHDWHGNHIREASTEANQLKIQEVRDYFDSGPSPYGAEKYESASKNR